MTVESYTRLFVVGMAMLSALACSNGDSDTGYGPDGGTIGWIVGAPAGDASSAGDAYATILYTDDGGQNWTRQGSYDTLPHTAVTSVVALDATHAWAVSEHEVLSTENGKTWTRHALPTAAAMETVYPVNNDVIWAVGFEATVLKSTDSGKSWSVSKVPKAQAQLQGLYALDDRTAWVGGGDPAGHLWRTIDGGTSWQLKYTGGPKLFETIRGVPDCTTVDLAHCRLWAGAGARRIIRSDDGGEIWELQTDPTTQFDDVNGLSVVDRNIVYAAVDFGMMVTTNGGEDWVSRSTDPKATFMIGVEAIDSQTAWFVGPEQDGPDLVGRVAYTKTQGRTWESAPSLPVYPEFYAISFAKQLSCQLRYKSINNLNRRNLSKRRGMMRCHKVDYEIFGDDMQIVEVELDLGETVVAEAGAMNYMEDGITFESRMGDGSVANDGIIGNLFSAGKRALTGESIQLTHFTNNVNEKKRVAFAAPYPEKIISIDMTKVGGELLCQKDAFLAAALGTEVGIAFRKRLGTGFFGGEGFILQRLLGNGMVFIHAGGTVIKKKLEKNVLRVDTGCLVAFTSGVDYDIERAGNLKSMFFGGEGFFLATLRGTGTVLLQSLPFSRMADRILEHAPSAGGSRKGEGSLLGKFGGMLDGN